MEPTPARRQIGVLVAEDDPDLRQEIVDGLRDAGFRCLAAPDGAAALEALRLCKQRLDVVLADIYMPRLGGIGLVGAMARLLRNGEVRAKLMAAKTPEEFAAVFAEDPEAV